MPPMESCIGILSKAIMNTEKKQFPSYIANSIFSEMLKYIIPHSDSFYMKLVFLQTNVFAPLIAPILRRYKQVNALIRTTISPTLFHSGVQFNVLPSQAKALLNIRIHPNDNIDFFLSHLKNSIQDVRVKMSYKKEETHESGKISCNDCLPFKILSNVIQKVYPNAIVAPFLFMAGKFYNNIK
jgi:carboxypeptidase PM20D1